MGRVHFWVAFCRVNQVEAQDLLSAFEVDAEGEVYAARSAAASDPRPELTVPEDNSRCLKTLKEGAQNVPLC